ncbi:hypothetical protein QBC37DRAFT_424884 [Rhypophila decipiens]|uniref:Uncharacterized protein n=1 Tax=Rhypophila decipiens TaxID=261697 RepID=A0AAN7B6T4_9PEZI|nr:hypothetical protein QBC37DRAFT_424884 [Rhypophila decipiens]
MSISTTCGCLAATRRLRRDDQTDDDEVTSNPLLRQSSSPSSTSFFSSPIPTPGPGSYPISPSSTSQAAAASSPSAALLHGRALTTHWARLSTTCPNSALHLASPTILRYMVTALRSITVKYEAHLWKMVFNATTTSAPLPSPIPGLAAGAPGAATAGHIGIYRLEQDETQILLQEALRTSIEELGGLLSEIQRRVVMIRAAAGNSVYSAGGGISAGLMNKTTSTGNGLFAGSSSSSLNLDWDMEMDTNMGTVDVDLEEEIQGPPPTDEEMSEINMRLYQCLRRLDFLENGEVGKDATRW